ncbi:MAG: ABC transporter ATP-binding protein [Ruminococcus sp.]|uniref:ABC transporter ATP-binding protein n=1 Tax=Ruminococcus sp. TaxID=41978 RepID=UPI0025F4AED9|nr:ABC transporter ATP-binding protein [Ruminococcus sp.]MCR5539926.1 ABC transporter ATP-binding protein [Ruminococcus sp.]
MENAIEIRGLVKEYKDFKLDSVDLTLPGGCILGLIGENGAGKSTMIKCLLGIIHKNEGSITILGRDADKELADIKEDVGVVLDDVGIPDTFKYKQINAVMKCTYKNWDEAEFEGYMDKFGLPKDKKFKEFSRGMKMKMGIAIALSHKAKLLVLDEATNGLDPVIRDEVTDIFYEFTRDEEHSILISSHIVSDLEKLCDYISFIHKGKVLLNEEKDVLLEEYAILSCAEEDLKELDPEAIRGRKSGKYGVQALVKRDGVPAGMNLSPVTIEELFIFMIKEIA